jgi:uncharacterized iron-regulated membrane protein
MPADAGTCVAPRTKSLRCALHLHVLSLHRWTGVSIGLILAFIAATGIFLAYRSRMEPAVYRNLLMAPACDARVPLDVLVSRARAAHPSGKLDYVRIKGADAGSADMPSTQIRLAGPGFQDDVFFAPCDGALLGQRARYGGFFGTVTAWHKLKFIEKGHLIAGSVALAFLLLLGAAGIYLWWPKCLKAVKPSLRANPRLRGRERTINLHKVVGVYASLVLVPTALTGLPQAFDWCKDGIYWITGSPRLPAPESVPIQGRKPLEMEAYWRKLQSLVPDPAEALIHWPDKPRDPVEIFAIERSAPHSNARTVLFLDAYTGDVLRFTPYRQSSLGHKAYFWTLSWHTGMVGGLAGPFILVTGSLALLFLAWSGLSSFVRRSLRARRT